MGSTIRYNTGGKAKVLPNMISKFPRSHLRRDGFVAGYEAYHFGETVDADHNRIVTLRGREVGHEVAGDDLPKVFGDFVKRE